jgi:hypothetical protein
MPVEGVVERPIGVIEVAGLPHLADLVAGRMERIALDGVLHHQGADAAVDLEQVDAGPGSSIENPACSSIGPGREFEWTR